MLKNKKLKIITLLFLAIIVSFSLYFLIIKFYVDPYLENYSDLNRAPLIFEFYNENIDCNKVYYWGSSSIKEDLDLNLVEEKDFCHYNLGNPASTPLRRIVELQHTINSKPEAVVFTVGYMSFSDNWIFPHDQYALISPYVNFKSQFYNQTHFDLLNMNELNLLLYKRKFIQPATASLLNRFKRPFYYKDYNEDFKSTPLIIQINKTHDPDFLKKLKEKEDFSEYSVPKESNIEKASFEYIIANLLNDDIKVIIVKIPLNPVLLEKIPEEYKENFNIFLDKISNKYNATILDYTTTYNETYFYDGHHLNKQGISLFSKDIVEKVENVI